MVSRCEKGSIGIKLTGKRPDSAIPKNTRAMTSPLKSLTRPVRVMTMPHPSMMIGNHMDLQQLVDTKLAIGIRMTYCSPPLQDPVIVSINEGNRSKYCLHVRRYFEKDICNDYGRKHESRFPTLETYRRHLRKLILAISPGRRYQTGAV